MARHWVVRERGVPGPERDVGARHDRAVIENPPVAADDCRDEISTRGVQARGRRTRVSASVDTHEGEAICGSPGAGGGYATYVRRGSTNEEGGAAHSKRGMCGRC